MDAATVTVVRSSMGLCRPSSSAVRSAVLAPGSPDFIRFGTRPSVSIKNYSSVSHLKPMSKRMAIGSRRCFAVRASMNPDPAEPASPIAPLQLESPVGQFLTQILVNHPHLVPAAVEQQLERLQTDRDAEQKVEEPAASGTDLILYRRIAEVKANERKRALEEILYALVVQKFMDADVPLVPTIASSSSHPSGCVDTCPSLREKLEQLHSTEAYEMIQNHLALILGNRLGDDTTVAQISKLRVGQVYAASVMYGYFLKRVDQRFQLEKTMKNLPNATDDNGNAKQADGEGAKPSGVQDSYQTVSSHPEVTPGTDGISPGSFGFGIKPSRLRSYVMSFDGETLQRYATIRSKEAVSIIEKHTEALFGRPEIVMAPNGTVDPSNEEHIKLSFGGLKRLVLEAVTFGSFLWDVESHVDSRYRFVLN